MPIPRSAERHSALTPYAICVSVIVTCVSACAGEDFQKNSHSPEMVRNAFERVGEALRSVEPIPLEYDTAPGSVLEPFDAFGSARAAPYRVIVFESSQQAQNYLTQANSRSGSVEQLIFLRADNVVVLYSGEVGSRKLARVQEALAELGG